MNKILMCALLALSVATCAAQTSTQVDPGRIGWGLNPNTNIQAATVAAGTTVSAQMFGVAASPLTTDASCASGNYWIAPVTGSVSAWRKCENGVLSNATSVGTFNGGTITSNAFAQASFDAERETPRYATNIPKALSTLINAAASRAVVVRNIGTSIDSFNKSPAKYLATALQQQYGASTQRSAPAASQAGTPINGWKPQYYTSTRSIRLRGRTDDGASAITFNNISSTGTYSSSFSVMYDTETDGGSIGVTVDGVAQTAINCNGAESYGNVATFTFTLAPHAIVLTPPTGGFGYMAQYIYGPTVPAQADGTAQERGFRYDDTTYGGSGLQDFFNARIGGNRTPGGSMYPDTTDTSNAGVLAAFCPSSTITKPDIVLYGGPTNDSINTNFQSQLTTAVGGCVAKNTGQVFILTIEPANDTNYPSGAGLNGGLSNDTSTWSTLRAAFYAVQAAYPENVMVADWDYYLAAHKYDPNFHAYTFTLGTGGTGYTVGDVLTAVQAGASGGTATVAAISGGVVTSVNTVVPGTHYIYASGLATTGGTGSGATLNVYDVTGGPHPQDNGYGDPYLAGGHYLVGLLGLNPPNMTVPTWDSRTELADVVTSTTEPCAPIGTDWIDTSNGTLYKRKVGSASAWTTINDGPNSPVKNSGTSGCSRGIWVLTIPSSYANINLAPTINSGSLYNGSWGTSAVNPDGTAASVLAANHTTDMWINGVVPATNQGQTYTFSFTSREPTADASSVTSVNITMGTATQYQWSPTTGWASTAGLKALQWYNITTEPMRRVLTFNMPTTSELAAMSSAGVDTTKFHIGFISNSNYGATISNLSLNPGASQVKSPVSPAVGLQYSPGYGSTTTGEPVLGSDAVIGLRWNDCSNSTINGCVLKQLVQPSGVVRAGTAYTGNAVWGTDGKKSISLWNSPSAPGRTSISNVSSSSATTPQIGTFTVAGVSVTSSGAGASTLSVSPSVSYSTQLVPLQTYTVSFLANLPTTSGSVGVKLNNGGDGHTAGLNSDQLTWTYGSSPALISYQVAAANTWQQVALTFLAPSTGTYNETQYTYNLYFSCPVSATCQFAAFRIEEGSSVTTSQPISEVGAALAFSATPFFDLASANLFQMTLTGSVTSSTAVNLVSGEKLTFNICQNSTGSYTFAWPSNFHGAMTIGSTASKCNVQTFTVDATGAAVYATSSGVTNQ